jgi:uncharacterized membrane protein YeiB
LFTGYYPAFSWTAYLAVGLLCARSDLTRPATRALMIVGGVAAALFGYGAALVLPGVSAAAHSDTTAELVGSGGVAVAVLGALTAITSPGAGPTGRARAVVARVLPPLADLGRMPLSIYTTQIIVLAVWRHASPDPDAAVYPLGLFLALALGSLAVAAVWQRFLGAGPLERAMRGVSRWPPPRIRDAS